MKRLCKYSHQWLVAMTLLAVALLACDAADDGPGDDNEPTEVPELADLVGRWGISQTQSGGNTETGVPCENTLEVTSTGSFTYVDVARGSWLEGTLAFNANDSSITLSTSGQTINLKLVEIANGSFTLQSEDNDGDNIVISTQVFTALESGDCAGMEMSMLVNKWSISAYNSEVFELQGNGDELGNSTGSEQLNNIPVNRFTTEFSIDGSYLNIDLINEYDYSPGEFRRLDDHNLILTFEDDGEEVEQLAHLKSLQGNTATFQTVRYVGSGGDNEQGESRIVTDFTMTINDNTVPTITEADLLGKWSASAVVESSLTNGQWVEDIANDNIPNNKMTLGFRDEGELLLIDLILGPQISLGEYEMLDASNILINFGNDEDGDDEEEAYQIFHLTANSNGQIVLESFELADAEEDHDVSSVEVTLTKNDGSEPTVSETELLGTWEVTEVENLGNEPSEEGPQVGMQLTFDEELEGVIVFERQQVFVFGYEFLDLSNLLLTFENEDESGMVEEDYNLFHVSARPGGNIEVQVYVIRASDGEGDGTGNGGAGEDHDDANMVLLFRLVLQKQ